MPGKRLVFKNAEQPNRPKCGNKINVIKNDFFKLMGHASNLQGIS